jgi:DNA-binding NarL/FixJ family response regulator
MPLAHTLLASTLLIAPAGRLWYSLRMVLAGCPEIVLVGEAHTDATALTLMAQWRPALALLDGGLADTILPLLALIKCNWPATRCLVLAENLQQMEEARARGADEVLLRGFENQELYTAIHTLLPTPPVPVITRDSNDSRPVVSTSYAQKGSPHANLQQP